MDKSLRAGSALLRRASRDAAAASRWSVSSATAMGAPPGNPTFATGSRCLASLAASSREWRAPPRGFAAAGPARGLASASRPSMIDDRFLPVNDSPEMDREYEKLVEEIKTSPKKRQRFLLTEALKGTRLKPLIAAEHELMKEEDEFKPRALETRVIDVNRTCKVTKGGGLMSFTALVVVGNGNGVVGFATGKGKDVGLAVDKAYSRASRSLVYIERFENSTIFHAQEAKHCKTKIRLMPAKAGEGLRCNQIVESICEMAGIKDLSAKVIGSHHPLNTVRACFEALESIQSPADIAAARGATVYRI